MKNKDKHNKHELPNWYKDILPESLKPKYHNPCFKDIEIAHPFRIVICGNSGSGKSSLALTIINKMKGTFDHLTLIVQNSNEPLYKFLESKLKHEQLTIVEGVKNIPDLDEYDNGDDEGFQNLVIFDDLCTESPRDQKIIGDFFIRGRKLNMSMMYLTQSYFLVPKVIRLQATNVFLKKLSSIRDLNMILSDFALGIDKEELKHMYKECTADQQDFFHVDVNAMPEKRFKKNFLQVLEWSHDV